MGKGIKIYQNMHDVIYERQIILIIKSQTVFVFSEMISRYERDQDDSVVHVSHSVTNYEFFYEPFYVSLDIVPEYDERFLGYGFTRNTQVRYPTET